MQKVSENRMRTREMAQGMLIKKQWSKEMFIVAGKYFSLIEMLQVLWMSL